MNITKKTLAVIEIIMLFFMTSCNKNDGAIKTDINDKTANVSEVTESNFAYNLSDQNILDEDVISCENLVDRYKDGFVFTGSASYPCSEFLVLTGRSGGQTQTGSFNPDTPQSDIISVKKKDNTIYFLCGSNGKGSITSYDQNGSQIERTELDFPPVDFVVGDKIYVLNSFGSSFSSKIEVYSDKLEHDESIDITYKSDGNTLDPHKIALSPQNEIYCIFSDKNDYSATKVMAVSDNNKIICNSVDDMNSVDDIFVNSKGNIILTGSEEGKYLVDELDKNGSIVTMSEIQNCDEVYGITDSDKIIFSNSEGVSSYYNDESELIISSDDFQENSIFACCIESDGCTAYLSSDFEKYNAVFITDQNNKIVSEIKADSIDDCFVGNDKIYVAGEFEHKSTVKVYDNGIITDTGIELDDDDRQSYKIGVLSSGEIIIYKCNENKYAVYSDTFEEKKSVNTNIYISGFCKSNDSLLCYDAEKIYRFNDKYETEKIDINTNESEKNLIFTSGNDEYDFLFSSYKGIYGYSSSENAPVFLIDYSKEMMNNVSSFLISEDDRILINSMIFVYEAKKDDQGTSKEPAKQILTIACYENNLETDTIRTAIRKFNSTSEKYSVEMKYYSSPEELSLDIVSEKAPDIIITYVLGDSLVTLLKDDSLTDINQFIEKDNELSRDMFYSSILDAFTYNNKLYSLPLTVRINTGKTIDNTICDNCSQLIDHISSTYSSDEYFAGFDYASNLSMIYLSEKADLENRKFDLSEMDLNKIITFIKKYDPEYFMFRNGNCDAMDIESRKEISENCSVSALIYYYSSLMSSLDDSSDGYYELGYPGVIGVAEPILGFSIMEKSENKDAAWEFIKTCYKSLGTNTNEGLYALKSMNADSVHGDDIPGDINQKFDSWMEGKCINPILYYKLNKMIYDEVFQNPDVSDEELSRSVFSKMKLYFAEIQ